MMKSLRFALEAAVMGARGSRVQLTTVSAAPRGPDVAGRQHHFHLLMGVPSRGMEN